MYMNFECPPPTWRVTWLFWLVTERQALLVPFWSVRGCLVNYGVPACRSYSQMEPPTIQHCFSRARSLDDRVLVMLVDAHRVKCRVRVTLTCSFTVQCTYCFGNTVFLLWQKTQTIPLTAIVMAPPCWLSPNLHTHTDIYTPHALSLDHCFFWQSMPSRCLQTCSMCVLLGWERRGGACAMLRYALWLPALFWCAVWLCQLHQSVIDWETN